MTAEKTSSNQMTVIAADTMIKGEMTFQTAARILGKFEGKITSQGRVEIGSGAECRADIEAGTIVVDGTVEGNIIAHDRLELSGSAIIKGDVVAAKLIAAEGASFAGLCAVGLEAVKSVRTLGQTPSAAPAKAKRPQIVSNDDLDNALAGMESKISGFVKGSNGTKLVAAD